MAPEYILNLIKILLQIDGTQDCEFYIFNIKQEKSQINYTFVDKTELLVNTLEEKSSGSAKKIWEGTLEKGVYVLIPSTTGCLFRKRANQPPSDVHLTYIDDESQETKLSEEYIKAIEEMYHQLDLDESGTLSRAEFNLYNWRTSNMELSVSVFYYYF